MKKEISRYIKTWENRCYSEGIPDEAPKEIDDMVPSYKRIAIAILKNDLGGIGVQKPISDYYGILKSIELNKEYKKSKRMTQSELRQMVYKLTNIAIAKDSYIKGYGTMFRIMDGAHNPIQNITKDVMNVFIHNEIFIRKGLVFNLNVCANPFANYLDVKLP